MFDQLCVPAKLIERVTKNLLSQSGPESGGQKRRAETANDPQIDFIIKRTAVIKHDEGSAARGKHAVNFAHSPAGIGGVMKDAMRVYEVEGTVGEGQVFCVSLREGTL